jgi:hypothetical protein
MPNEKEENELLASDENVTDVTSETSEPVVVPSRRGRKKGSKNKPKEQADLNEPAFFQDLNVLIEQWTAGGERPIAYDFEVVTLLKELKAKHGIL